MPLVKLPLLLLCRWWLLRQWWQRLAFTPFLNRCVWSSCSPYVIMLKPSIVELAKEYQAKGVKIVAVSSNSIQTHPQDGPEKMKEDATTHHYPFPFLFDETQVCD